MIQAFLAAISQTGGIIIDKIVLTRRQMEIHVFIPLVFMFLFLLSAILFPFLGTVKLDLFNLNEILLFVAMIVTAIVWNIFYYKGVQAEKVHEYESIIMFQPLLTVALAALVFGSERNIHVLIAAVVAAVALIYSRAEKKHFEFGQGSIYLLIAVVLMSVELILTKPLLTVFSPVAFYFFRTIIMFVFFYLYYRPQLTKVSTTNAWLVLLTCVFGTVQMVSKYYGFETLGIVYTSLVLMLAPILVYIISTIWLHERIKFRLTAATIIIFLCVVYATFIR